MDSRSSRWLVLVWLWGERPLAGLWGGLGALSPEWMALPQPLSLTVHGSSSSGLGAKCAQIRSRSRKQ